jgi:hypothetical protein
VYFDEFSFRCNACVVYVAYKIASINQEAGTADVFRSLKVILAKSFEVVAFPPFCSPVASDLFS